MRKPKVVVITGASSGLGAALALRYASEGMVLHLFGRHQERLNQVILRCRALGAKACGHQVDVLDKQEMEAQLLAIDEIDPVDIVIANAGVSAGTLGGEDIEQVLRLCHVNIDGVIHTIYPILSRMRQRQSGQIVVISSMAGLLPLPGAPAYSASKAAIRVYTEALRGEVAKDRVGVTVVIPGYIKTAMTEVNHFPMPFIMESEKAADLIVKKLKYNPARITFPKQFYFGLLLISMLPSRLLVWILAKLPQKGGKVT